MLVSLVEILSIILFLLLLLYTWFDNGLKCGLHCKKKFIFCRFDLELKIYKVGYLSLRGFIDLSNEYNSSIAIWFVNIELYK